MAPSGVSSLSGGLPRYRPMDPRARRVRRPPPVVPRIAVWVLFGAIAIFYLQSIYHGGVASLLKQVKWVALIGLLATATLFVIIRYRTLPKTFNLTGPAIFLMIVALSIPRAEDSMDALLTFVSIALAVLAGRALATLFGTLEGRRRFFDICLILGRLVIASTALMCAAGINLGRGGSRVTGWVDNPNTLAILLAPALVITMAGVIERRRGWVLWHAAFLVPGLVLLKLTDSRAGLLWVTVSAIGFWIFRKGVTITGLFAISAVTIVLGWWDTIVPFVTQNLKREYTNKVVVDVLSGRSEVWPLGWDLAHDKPMLGYGLGSSGSLIERNIGIFREFMGGTFHNTYLTALVETGVLGAGALIAVLAIAVAGGLMLAKQVRGAPRQEWPTLALPWAMLLGALIHAFFESSLFAAGSANSIITWTIIWMLCDAWRTRPMRQRHAQPPPQRRR